MTLNSLQLLAGNTDIYLMDQILKGRYQLGDKILDAGCGTGRNMHWFVNNGYDITGTDINAAALNTAQENYRDLPGDRLINAPLTALPFEDESFNHVICNAVLHFAGSTEEFFNMFTGLFRILKAGGSIFIRMTSDTGLKDKVRLTGDGTYLLPDGSLRFLLTEAILAKILTEYPVRLSEPFKSVNVNDLRVMSTLCLTRTGQD